MISRILCPIDFSEVSTRALGYAAAIADWYDAGLTALHVHHPSMANVPELSPVAAEAECERRRAQALALLPLATSRHHPRVDVVVDLRGPAPAILEQAAALRSDLIVIGTHGAGGVEHLMLGSTTEKIIRKAGCPVLTVPPGAPKTSHLPFRRVLCAVDFSEWSHLALRLAASLARESGAALETMHVIEWPWHEPPAPVFSELPPAQGAALAAFRRDLERSVAARLESVASTLRDDRLTVTARIGHGKPHVELVRAAIDDGVDLLVLGVHGRTLVDRAVFGSTANQVVRHARCPVLTVRG